MYNLELTDEEMRYLIMALEWYKDNELPSRAERAAFFASAERADEVFQGISKDELKQFARESNAVFSVLKKAEELYD